MIAPHNTYKPVHTTGLKITLSDYLRILTTKSFAVEGTMSWFSSVTFTSGEETTTTTSKSSIRYNGGTLAMKHLRADDEWRDSLGEQVRVTKTNLQEAELWPADNPLPWQIYGKKQKLPNSDNESVLDVVWLGIINSVQIGQTDGGEPVEISRSPDRYEYLLLPMGGGSMARAGQKLDDEQDVGLFANLDYSNPSAQIIVRLPAGGYDLQEVGGGPGDPYFFSANPLQCFFASAEGFKKMYKPLGGTSISWQTKVVGQIVVGDAAYEITAELPRYEGSSEGLTFFSEFTSSSLKLTAKW